MNGKRRLLFFFLACLFLAACSAGAEEGPRPPKILYGQDLCVSCGMVIDQARFAAATLLTDGEYRKFDDIREMLIYHMEQPTEQAVAWFVHDYRSEDWLRGEEAFYVDSGGIATPMGGGIVAFGDQAEAQTFAAEQGGAVYNLDEIRAKVHAEEHP
ncbi:MAG: nitrous oxide reductase accessory protein NosL [Chloroflexi bacterium]|nr:nitrous oxide reductase accessory protein NosL [Chloroflexota bacterium]